ncbi:MAG: hypothetical protein WCD04_04890, partial [Terriglobia bacterium]
MSFMYAPHEHAQHPCHRVPPVACPGLLKVADIKGDVGATPGSTTSPNARCNALLLHQLDAAVFGSAVLAVIRRHGSVGA